MSSILYEPRICHQFSGNHMSSNLYEAKICHTFTGTQNVIQSLRHRCHQFVVGHKHVILDTPASRHHTYYLFSLISEFGRYVFQRECRRWSSESRRTSLQDGQQSLQFAAEG